MIQTFNYYQRRSEKCTNQTVNYLYSRELRAIKVGSRSDNAACILSELKIPFLIVCHNISSTILFIYFLKNYCRFLSCDIF